MVDILWIYLLSDIMISNFIRQKLTLLSKLTLLFMSVQHFFFCPDSKHLSIITTLSAVVAGVLLQVPVRKRNLIQESNWSNWLMKQMVKQDFITLESYHCGNSVMLCGNYCKVSCKNMFFTSQNNMSDLNTKLASLHVYDRLTSSWLQPYRMMLVCAAGQHYCFAVHNSLVLAKVSGLGKFQVKSKQDQEVLCQVLSWDGLTLWSSWLTRLQSHTRIHFARLQPKLPCSETASYRPISIIWGITSTDAASNSYIRYFLFLYLKKSKEQHWRLDMFLLLSQLTLVGVWLHYMVHRSDWLKFAHDRQW